MLPSHRCWRWLSALALLGVALPALAAPAPVVPGAPKLDKYFLDDTDFVLVVNVKQIVASPLFAKNFRKQVEAWRDALPARAVLQALGVDPLKDVDRVVVLTGKSCHGDGGPNSGGPFVLASGRFDPARLRGGLAKLAKTMPDKVVAHGSAGSTVYEVKGGSWGSTFVAPLDAHTVVLAGRKEQALEALAKAGGKKMTRLAIPEVAAWLKKVKPDVAVQGLGTEHMVLNATKNVTVDANGQRVTKVHYHTLAAGGLKGLHVHVVVKDDVRARVTLTAQDAAKCREMVAQVRQLLPLIKPGIEAQAQRDAKLAPLVKMVEAVKFETQEPVMTFEATFTAEMVKALLHAMQR